MPAAAVETARDRFARDGFVTFSQDPVLRNWVSAVAPQAAAAARDPALLDRWLRYDGTWFVGVDALGNRPDGSVGGSAPLAGRAAEFCRALTAEPEPDWGSGQVSVCYPGYPEYDGAEPEALFNYRIRRDGAHIDGLKPVGDRRRRMMQEFHVFILGIPLVAVPAGAAPFVIWRGSHHLIRDMLRAALADVDPADWSSVDLTETYQQTRRQIWAECERVELPAKPGEAYVAHRFSLHGVAPWRTEEPVPDAGRMIVYFRPHTAPSEWFLSDD